MKMVICPLVGFAIGLSSPAAERPNVLWITAEDMSPNLGCYGDDFAVTPHLDAFAKTATRYDKAFAVSPVCSPSRSSIITGVHNVTLGTHQMRSAFPLPDGVRGFPSYLRAAGYFTTNNVKTDYNTSDAARLVEESWDESSPKAHWRSDARKDGQPFFSVFNIMTSHQSRTMVWPHEAFEKHVQSKIAPSVVRDPELVPLPPYYPDTPTVRRGMARYYDCVSAMDQEVGEILSQLEDDGLADETVVFFYSDHGMGMPRGKRLLHDSGMRVAMLVHLPEKWAHLRETKPGGASDRLVSFLDLAPTVLSLAAVETPGYLQGLSMLGERRRDYVYGSRDRVDEAFETSRSIRDGNWLYIRRYRPHLGWLQPTVFSDLGEIRPDIVAHSAKVPNHVEELYDCGNDPHCVENLVGAGNASEALDRLRAAFAKRRTALHDLGALPESEMRRYVRDEGAPMGDIVAGKTDHSPDLQRAWAAADKVGIAKREEFLAMLKQGNTTERYWAVIGLRHAMGGDPDVPPEVVDHLDDISPAVRIELASWLGEHERFREAAVGRLVEDLQRHPFAEVQLHACRAIELLGEKAKAALPAMKMVYGRTRDGEGDDNLFLAFSSGAFLDALGEETKAWDFAPK